MTPTLRSAVQNRIKVGIFAGGVAGVLGLVLALEACDGEVAGCRFRSVDKGAYVARNDAVLRTVPVYPGSKLLSDESAGMHAGNSCGLSESGPPYASYWTTRRYSVSSDTPKGAIIGYYRRVLGASWRWTAHSVPDPGQPLIDSTFQRGDASLYVLERTADDWLITVDYAGFASQKP
jgi:hypothetical protein